MRLMRLSLLTLTALNARVCSDEKPDPQALAKLDAAALAQAIDQHVQRRLDEAKIQASPQADDAEFLRRVYLDIHGLIPPADKVVAFLDSGDPDKRARVIDELLASPRYAHYQADIWTSILYRILLERRYSPPKELFTQWLEEAFNKNMSWDRQVRELITGSGATGRNGAVAYLVHSKGVRSIEEVTNLTARVFLGRADIKCAQCHSHPFTSLKRDEYWGMAAFFSQLEVVRDSTYKGLQNGNLGVQDRVGPPRKEVDMPDGFRAVPPRFLEGEQPALDPSIPYRKVLAEWLTSPKNPIFARAKVNRTWAHFFGTGLVNPIDEMNELNAPSHPELFALLAEQFANNGFDQKYLIRAICSSKTYQRSSRTTPANAGDTELYSHMRIKVLLPRQLFDSLERIAAVPVSSKGARDNFNASFATLDSTDGELPDPTEYNRNLAQQVKMMTANPPFQNLVGSLLKQVGASGQAPQQVVEGLYLRVLSRRPSSAEIERAADFVQGRGDAGYTELARVLLTTSEFTLNH